MIPLAEINVAANKLQVSAETIEKDYVISWILFCLAKSNLKNDFTFYGGTAIKRIYFEDHRFSEDIDLLSTKKISKDDLLRKLDVLQYAREEVNLILEVDKNNIISNRHRLQMFIRYSGYDEIVGAPKEVRIDFSMGMHLYGEVVERKIIASYSDLKIQDEATLFVMSLNTILANKLGLLTEGDRNEPRDLFDIWFLLQRTDRFEFDFEQICKIFKEKYSYRPSKSVLLQFLQNPIFRRDWDMRLKKQIAELPDVKIVIKDVEAWLRTLFGEM